ncbi:MAG: CHASE2 domain-containing protein [Syntrophales bacterium]|nr:CHASE2 domain-containing protein [Syntrophales bacterium]
MNNRLKTLFTVSPIKITFIIIVVVLIAFFIDTPFLRFMELKTLDLRMVSRGRLAPGGEVVIATIDEKSLSEIGRWPWPRTVIARLVDKLKGNGAKAIGFDIVFSEPDENSALKTIADLSKEMNRLGVRDKRLMDLFKGKRQTADTDAILAKSIKKADNVTLGYFFHTSQKDMGHMKTEDIALSEELIGSSRYPMVKASAKPDELNLLHSYAAVPNLKTITESAVNSGYFNAFPDPDGVIRWAPLAIKLGDNYYYSLAMGVLLQYADLPMVTLKLNEAGVESIQIDDLTIPVDETGRLLINYLGPARTFPHYSISDILRGRISPEKFKDKIVIVGATATGIYDLRVTPFSNVYPGVEIHANVVDNILHRSFLEHSVWVTFLDVCTIIILGFMVGFIVPRVKAVYGVILILGMLAAFIAANTMIFIHYRIWLNMIYPLLTMATIYLMITVYRYVTEEREKKKIRGAFQYYLTASVMNEILKDPTKLKLGGDKKDLTVMFSDIRGFTTISEKLTPQDLVHLLNEYLTAMTNIVFKYEGLLDKYIGDAIMAVWGDPIDQPDHTLRACRTGLEMMAALRVLQEKWQKEGWPLVDIGIGINSGDMVVGNMGSDMRFDYTVMGDNVNLSSRLEGINKEYGTHIVISEFAYQHVKDEMFCRELDSVRVKGKKLPVKIYELICDRKDADPHESYVKLFEEGLAKYKKGLWDDGIVLFKKVLEIKPDDPPSKLYICRCEELKASPPEGVWDGVFTMTRK